MKPLQNDSLDRNTPQVKTPVKHIQRTLSLFVIMIVLCGGFLRFSDLSAPLLDFHPTRQLFGAIKARGLYYQYLSKQNEAKTSTAGNKKDNWQMELAVRQFEGEATIEPPIMENISAYLYRFSGEQTAIPRAISSAFWMLGGLFLFLLAKNLSKSAGAAAAGLAFYLLIPYSIPASRSFQPDPLMVLLLLITWWSFENWSRCQSWRWTIISGLSGGLAIFIKFPAAFFVIGAAAGGIFAFSSPIKMVRQPKTWIVVFLGLLPPAAYLIYGTYFGGFLDQQFGSRFYPELWSAPIFYLRWFLTLENLANAGWIGLAVLGWLVFSNKPAKIFQTGLWTAYIIFGLTFAHHISSHDYYSLPMIPILALGLAQLLPVIISIFKVDEQGKNKLIAGKGTGVPAGMQTGTTIILILTMITYTLNLYLNQRNNDFRQQAAYWLNVGNVTGHQPGVLAMSTDYGYPLAYYGWQNSTPWPSSGEINQLTRTFKHLSANKSYFLVTDMVEYERQPGLQTLLQTTYPVLAQGQGYLLFDLLHPKK